jgi:hypothetical protein
MSKNSHTERVTGASDKRVISPYSPKITFDRFHQMMVEKYYNLFMSIWAVDGDLDNHAKNFLLRKLYANGTVAAYNVPLIDELAFADYAAQSYDRYDWPSSLTLINNRDQPVAIVPNTPLPVNAEGGAVIGYLQPNHKGIKDIIESYATLLAEVKTVIYLNLQLQKMPYIVKCGQGNVNKMQDIVNRILTGQTAVFLAEGDAENIDALTTNAPYLIDKLIQFQSSLEGELKTLMGVDNVVADTKSQYINKDETDANNQEITHSADTMQQCLDEFSYDIYTYLHKTIVFTRNVTMTGGSDEEGIEGNKDNKEDKGNDND